MLKRIQVISGWSLVVGVAFGMAAAMALAFIGAYHVPGAGAPQAWGTWDGTEWYLRVYALYWAVLTPVFVASTAMRMGLGLYRKVAR